MCSRGRGVSSATDWAFKPRVLVVGDRSVTILDHIEGTEAAESFVWASCATLSEATAVMAQVAFDAVVSAVTPESAESLTLLVQTLHASSDAGIVVLAAHRSLVGLAEAIGAGAVDYLPWPLSPGELFSAVERACEWRSRMRGRLTRERGHGPTALGRSRCC